MSFIFLTQILWNVEIKIFSPILQFFLLLSFIGVFQRAKPFNFGEVNVAVSIEIEFPLW